MKLEPKPKVRVSYTTKCPHCNFHNPPTNRVCARCKQPLPEPANSIKAGQSQSGPSRPELIQNDDTKPTRVKPQKKTPKKSSFRNILFAIISLLLIFLIVLTLPTKLFIPALIRWGKGALSENHPVLISPAEKAVVGASVGLWWEQDPEAIKYTVTIKSAGKDDQKTFSYPNVDEVCSNDRCGLILPDLADGEYTWKVESSVKKSKFTSMRIFTVDTGKVGKRMISITEYAADPSVQLLITGEAITWINQSSKPLAIWQNNAAASVGFESGWIEPGAGFTYLFKNPGEYTYTFTDGAKLISGKLIVENGMETSVQTITPGDSGKVSLADGASITITDQSILFPTAARIERISSSNHQNEGGTVVSDTYNFEIGDFKQIKAGEIELRIPYSEAQLPPGMDENTLQASYYDGQNWIGVPGVVNTQENYITVKTNHLSWWQAFSPCQGPFSALPQKQKNLYELARTYISRLGSHADLFDTLRASDGTRLFELDAETTLWLSHKSLCALGKTSEQEILDHLKKALTPNEVLRGMLVIGDGLDSQVYDANKERAVAETIVDVAKSFAQVEPPLMTGEQKIYFELAKAGIKKGKYIAELPKQIMIEMFFELYVRPLVEIAYDLKYVSQVGTLQRNINTFLDHSETEQVGTSGLPSFPGEAGLKSSHCSASYIHITGDPDAQLKDFYQIDLYGNINALESGARAPGYINLFRNNGNLSYLGMDLENDMVYFVLGLQDMSPFSGALLGQYDRTDDLIILLEYEDNNGDPRVNRMLIENTRLRTFFCYAGYMALPDIREGSEVKVTYYFLEDGRPETRFTSVQRPITNDKKLCYRSCIPLIMPPVVVASPTIDISSASQHVITSTPTFTPSPQPDTLTPTPSPTPSIETPTPTATPEPPIITPTFPDTNSFYMWFFGPPSICYVTILDPSHPGTKICESRFNGSAEMEIFSNYQVTGSFTIMPVDDGSSAPYSLPPFSTLDFTGKSTHFEGTGTTYLEGGEIRGVLSGTLWPDLKTMYIIFRWQLVNMLPGSEQILESGTMNFTLERTR